MSEDWYKEHLKHQRDYREIEYMSEAGGGSEWAEVYIGDLLDRIEALEAELGMSDATS